MNTSIISFMIIGAGKSGTTSLCSYLSQHPNICMSSPKEPWFFDTEQYEKGLKYYCDKYFSHWKHEKAVGEASSQNLYVPFVPRRIRNSIPNAKLIAILRNPVERAYSDWWMKFGGGSEIYPFEKAVKEDLKRIEAGISFIKKQEKILWYNHIDRLKAGSMIFRAYIDYGYYAQQLRRYLDLFPRSQIKIILFDDFCRNPRSTVKDIFNFLELHSGINFVDEKPKNVAASKRIVKIRKYSKRIGLSKWLPMQFKIGLNQKLLKMSRVGKPEMDDEIRKWLISHYYRHNRDLEILIDRDLSHWDNSPEGVRSHA